ncbi:TipJ family phage tail tip protein [Treponema endosymbiont of Eucomonympha sp.]|uniref:TipJ family phage tail tip protein n=1 Tax=Treponema endosymbiont of Eucomonympha sp. TaxID=1580831 RepID=UPI000750ADB3|nr:hypothetical protein [Treponema endosymbiont of Eucomonympha sp.]
MGFFEFWQDFGKTLSQGLAIVAGTVLMVVPGAQLLGVGLLAYGVNGIITTIANGTAEKAREQEAGSKLSSVRGSKNRLNQSGYVPVLFGRHLATPDLAMPPFTEIVGDDMFLCQLFVAGYNDMDIERATFKLGETPLTEFSKTKNIDQIIAGTDPFVRLEILADGEASQICPACVHEAQVNTEVRNKAGKDDDAGTGDIVGNAAPKAEKILADVFFQNGLVHYNDKGGKDNATVELLLQYKAEGASGWTDFPGWNKTITRNTPDMFRLTAAASGLDPAKQYLVRAARNTPDATSANTRDAVHLGSVRSIRSERPIRSDAAQRLMVLALRVKASKLASGVIDSFNFVAQAKMSDYFEGGWSTRLTRNPASALLYALTGQANPAPVDAADIDMTSIEEFHDFCREKGFRCDALLAGKERFADLLGMIATSGRAEIARRKGKFAVVVDKERSDTANLFSPRNTISYAQQIMKMDVPDEISCSFTDETTGWQLNARSAFNTADGLPDGTAKTKQTSSLWGVTDPDTVFKFVRYMYACIKNRPLLHIIKLDLECLTCKKGDLIEYAGDAALTGTAYARVKKLILDEGGALGLISDTVFPMEEGESYGIRCRRQNGVLVTLRVKNEGKSERFLYFQDAQSEYVLAEGDLVAFGVMGKITRQLLVREIAAEDGLRATLTCVDYSPEIYAVDDPSYVVPPFDNKITSGGTVDSGIALAEEWQTWTTFSEQKDKPDAPEGAGNSGGWHRDRTPQSRWLSVKTASSVNRGTWSEPERTALEIAEDMDTGSFASENPDTIIGLTAAAQRDGIAVSWLPPGPGLHNRMERVVVEVLKSEFGYWEMYYTADASFFYAFSRETDGYPEASNLAAWRIRAKGINIFGRVSLEWGGGDGGVPVSTAGYGTWFPDIPVLSSATAGRTVNMAASPQGWYGAGGIEVQIRKVPAPAAENGAKNG